MSTLIQIKDKGSMKRFINVVMIGLVALLCVCCEKDNDELAYSTRGAEQDKTIIYNSSKVLNDELSQLSQTKFASLGYYTTQRLSDHELTGNAIFVKAIMSVGNTMYQQNSGNCYFSELLNLAFNNDDYCKSIDISNVGVWQWDDDKKTFSKTENHNEAIVYKFPATQNTEGDTAVMTITELDIYSGSLPNNGAILEDNASISEMLSSLKLNIKVEDELILSCNLWIQFTDDNFFESIALTFNPVPYTFMGEQGKLNTEGYWTSSFFNQERVVLNHRLAVTFNNSQPPIKRINNDLIVDKIIIVTEAKTDFLYQHLLKAEEESGEQKAKLLAKAFNDNATMQVRHIDDNSILANIEAVAKMSSDQTWWVDLEFEFSDGSIVSGEEYFNDYLNTFKLELKKLIGEFESKFGV